MSKPIVRILIIDATPLLAESLSCALGQISNFQTCVCVPYDRTNILIKHFKPRIVIINIEQGCIKDSLDSIFRADSEQQECKIIAIASMKTLENDSLIIDAVKSGIDGVLLKEHTSLPHLIDVIHNIDQCQQLLDAQVIRKALEYNQENVSTKIEGKRSPYNTPLLGNLTPREREVAEYMLSGSTTKEMAETLSISERTVHSHINSILAKLNVHSRAEAIAYLYQSSFYAQPGKSREVGG